MRPAGWIAPACAVGLLLVGKPPVGGSEPRTAPSGLLFRNVAVFDGERLLPAQDVLVETGHIARVGRPLAASEEVTTIEGAGKTLLPGLIDAHTHDWGDSPRQALLFGVTTELNMGARPEFVAALRRAARSGEGLPAATLLTAGNVVTPPNGHGTEYGIPVPTLERAVEAQAFVDARLTEGSDYVKVILEDGGLCHQHFAKLPKDVLDAAVRATHARNRLVIAHVTSQDDLRAAITAGVDGVAHLFADSPPRPDVIALVRDRGGFVVTTVGAIRSALGSPAAPALLADPRLAGRLSAEARSQVQQRPPFTCSGSLANAFAAVRSLHAAGVPLLAGTDAPAPGSWNGASLHIELELLVEAGLEPADALAAATSVPARVFHLDHRGRIAPGYQADLLLVRGDPTRTITSTRDIVAVWKAGVRIAGVP